MKQSGSPRPEVCNALAAYAAGEISAEIALMRLLLALGDDVAVFDFLENHGAAELLRVAKQCHAGLARTAALIRAGLARERAGSIDAIREQFDRAATLSPEAAVALYSLGSAETLDRATAEIVGRLREYRLLVPSVVALDIGCGIGRIERALSPHLAHITGADVSPEMIAEARRRCADLPNVDFTVCGGADLAEFFGRRFDLILAIDSFPYLVAADPAIARQHIAGAAGLLAHNGVLVILNYSYGGDLDADRGEVHRLAAAHGFSLERDGTRDFTLWDAATFLLRKR
jgi:predicted TPR repeat methyltransferase